MNAKETRERIKQALWRALEERKANGSEIDRRLGKRRGWLYDQKERCTKLDVGDLWAILQVAGIEPLQFLEETLPAETKTPEPQEEGELADQILRKARILWESR